MLLPTKITLPTGSTSLILGSSARLALGWQPRGPWTALHCERLLIGVVISRCFPQLSILEKHSAGFQHQRRQPATNSLFRYLRCVVYWTAMEIKVSLCSVFVSKPGRSVSPVNMRPHGFPFNFSETLDGDAVVSSEARLPIENTSLIGEGQVVI